MAGDIKTKYGASVAMTVTALHSLAASQTLVAGWSSASVSNTSALNLDYMVSGTFTTASANRQVGVIEVWVLAALNDTPTWPALATGAAGTQGAASFTADLQKLSYGRLLTSFYVTATASQTYAFPPTGIAQLFGGQCPTHWALFVTGSATTTTTAQFAASGSAIHYTPVLAQYT